MRDGPARSRPLAVAALCGLLAAGPAAARNIPYPLVLVHGLGEQPRRWAQVEPGLKALGLEPGGVVQASTLYRRPRPPGYDPRGDYFLLRFDDNQGAVLDLVRELRLALAALRRDSGAPAFVLVGFSLGGVVSRAYLTRYTRRHYVRKLVTLGAPHLGTPWARLYDVAAAFKTRCRSSDNAGALLLAPACAALAVLERHLELRLDSPALRDLAPPRWDDEGRPANLTARLAVAPHPADVEYVSVVGRLPLPRDWKALESTLEALGRELEAGDYRLSDAKARLLGLLQHLLGLVTGTPGWRGGGDGGVPAASQDLSRLPWFARRIAGERRPEGTGFDTRWYTLRGLDSPLRVEYVQAHHLLQPRLFHILYRAVASPPRLAARGPRRSWLGRVTLRGRLEDYWLQPGQLAIAGLDLAPRFDADRLHFRFEDLPLSPGPNRLELRYGVDHGFRDARNRVVLAVDYRPSPLLAWAWRRRWILAALLAAALLGLALAWRRRRLAG